MRISFPQDFKLEQSNFEVVTFNGFDRNTVSTFSIIDTNTIEVDNLVAMENGTTVKFQVSSL